MTLLSTMNSNTKSTNFVYKFIEIHLTFVYNLDFNHMIPLFLAEICLLGLLDPFIHLFVAISKEMTVNELNKPWEYKYNLKERVVMGGNQKRVFEQKFYPLCENVWNTIKFFLGFKLPTAHKIKLEMNKLVIICI